MEIIDNKVYIVSAKRTPVGSFGGVLASVPSTQLGADAIRAAVAASGIDQSQVEEVYMGAVLQANLGQAPARQASKLAGLPDSVNATTVNKVCASGMKAITLAAQSILLGDSSIAVAGGMENMSRVPFYSDGLRWGVKYGQQALIDGLEKDGLTDVYGGYSMGICGERCAEEYDFSREAQDTYAVESYQRSSAAWQAGHFNDEVVPVTVKGRKGEEIILEDEEYKRVFYDKIPVLKPAFKSNGTITAANASTMNDGASALVLASGRKVRELSLKPLASVVAYADAEQEPDWFTTTPALAGERALKKAGLTIGDIDYFEINEAYAVVALANARLLNIELSRLNVNGGAVALGHPLGSSGSRIVVTLAHVLKQRGATYGLAAICNGGGGATALIIENYAG